jgi:WD40 repeat protein
MWVNLSLWDVASGKFLRQLGGLPPGMTRGGFRYPLAFSPDGKTVAGVPFYGQVLCLWDTETGEQRSLAGQDRPVEDVVASPDGKTIASRGQYDTTVQLWDAGTGKHLHTLRGHRSQVAALAFTPDGQTLISGGTAKDDLHLWEVATGKELREIKADIDQSFASLAIAPNGKTLAAGTSLGAIFLWELATGKPLLRFQAHPPAIDPESGEVEHYFPVNTLLFSPDGKTLVSGSHALTLYVWSAATGQKLRVFQEAGTRVGGASLAFSPDGKTLTALGRGERSFVWELASGKKRREFRTPPIHQGSPGWSAFSADARTFAICGYPYDTIHVWDLVRGEELGRFKGHAGRVTGLRFIPGGHRVVSASDDTTILVWEGISHKKDEGVKPVELSAEGLATLWLALADDDAAKAYQAMRTLMTSPRQAVALIQDHLRPVPPVPPVPPKRITQLIADLDSDHFAVRDKASRELARLGPLAEPELKKVLAKPPSLEVRIRVQHLLAMPSARVFTQDQLRIWRALEVMEHIGRPAQDVLQRMAQGAPGHFLTEEAKSALKRLGLLAP